MTSNSFSKVVWQMLCHSCTWCYQSFFAISSLIAK